MDSPNQLVVVERSVTRYAETTGCELSRCHAARLQCTGEISTCKTAHFQGTAVTEQAATHLHSNHYPALLSEIENYAAEFIVFYNTHVQTQVRKRWCTVQ